MEPVWGGKRDDIFYPAENVRLGDTVVHSYDRDKGPKHHITYFSKVLNLENQVKVGHHSSIPAPGNALLVRVGYQPQASHS